MTLIAIYAVALYAALFFGEFYLAGQKPFWPGLVLPAITFGMAMVNVISYAGTGYGNIVSNFFTSNVVTFLLLLLYFVRRRSIK
jgi:hypothetical protein